MAARRNKHPEEATRITPTQEDEADIVAEVRAERDPDTDALVVDEDKIREIGAFDAESVRENRRLDTIVGKKRANMKQVHFNVNDVLMLYDQITRYWPPNNIHINVKRLTGTPVQQTITSAPKNGQELYEALKLIHGQNPEASYEVNFVDATTKHYLGKSNITMPGAAVPAQGQPPMNPQYPYGPQAAPPPAAGYPPTGYPQPQQPQQPPPAPLPPAPPPVAAAPPVAAPTAAMDFASFMALQKQQFEFWQQAQQRAVAAPQAPPAAVVPPPPAPPAVDGALVELQRQQALLELQRQQFELWQRAQAGAPTQSTSPPAAVSAVPPIAGMTFVPGIGFVLTERLQQLFAASAQSPVAAPAVQQQPSPTTPAAAGMPPVQPPPGMVFVPGWGFVAIEALARAQTEMATGRPAPPAPSPPYRPPYRAPYYQGPANDSRPYYGPGVDQPPPAQYQPPPRPKTATEELRDAVSVVESMISVADRFRPPQQQQQPYFEQVVQEDDSPVRIIDAGPAKIVVNREDGKLRAVETGWANMDRLLKWAGEQREAIMRAQAEREQQQRQQSLRQHLPPGYVEVTPGYQPPPGYVVVPVDQPPLPAAVSQPPPPPPQQQLPDPPAHMPAPVPDEPRPSYGMPPMPGVG